MNMSNKTILIVDDEDQIRDAFKRAFERVGYSTHVAENGEAALEVLKTSGQVDLVAHRSVNQPGLFGTGDHLQVDGGLLQDPPDELEPVLGLPHGAGGHGPEGVELQLLHLLSE